MKQIAVPCTPQTCSSFHAKSIIFNYGSNATVLSTKSSRLPITSEASLLAASILLGSYARRILAFDIIIVLVNALIISRTDYYSSILVGYDIYLLKLQGVLDSAARLIARRRKYDSISSTIRDVLH